MNRLGSPMRTSRERRVRGLLRENRLRERERLMEVWGVRLAGLWRLREERDDGCWSAAREGKMRRKNGPGGEDGRERGRKEMTRGGGGCWP
jgi:hypothetical protein